MTDGFPERLARLVEHRGLNPDDAPAVAALLDGARPDGTLLREAAPVLGLHTADLFAIAGVDVPDDLAPLDASAASRVGHFVHHFVRFTADGRAEVLGLIASLPQEPRTAPFPEAPAWVRSAPGPGALIWRLLLNRNLKYTDTAVAYAVFSGRFWAASTCNGIATGRVELTPDIQAEHALMLGLPAADLAALTGIPLPATTPEPTPALADAAALLWAARRLTRAQAARHLPAPTKPPNPHGPAN